jgi:hypothetical protein
VTTQCSFPFSLLFFSFPCCRLCSRLSLSVVLPFLFLPACLSFFPSLF